MLIPFRPQPPRSPLSLAESLSPPAGRVAHELCKHNVELFAQLQHDVGLAVLIEAVSRFLRLTVHLQKVPGGYRATERDSTRRFDLLRFQQDLRRCDPDLQQVLAARAKTHPDGTDFSLLTWVRDHCSDFDSGHSALVDVSNDTPFRFGLPLPSAMSQHGPRQMPLTVYEGVVGRRLEQAFARVEALMPDFAPVRAQSVAQEVAGMGQGLFKGVELPAWLDQPRMELGGHSVNAACRTEAGYRACRELLQSFWLR